jgi:hypothetical protein
MIFTIEHNLHNLVNLKKRKIETEYEHDRSLHTDIQLLLKEFPELEDLDEYFYKNIAKGITFYEDVELKFNFYHQYLKDKAEYFTNQFNRNFYFNTTKIN